MKVSRHGGIVKRELQEDLHDFSSNANINIYSYANVARVVIAIHTEISLAFTVCHNNKLWKAKKN